MFCLRGMYFYAENLQYSTMTMQRPKITLPELPDPNPGPPALGYHTSFEPVTSLIYWFNLLFLFSSYPCNKTDKTMDVIYNYHSAPFCHEWKAWRRWGGKPLNSWPERGAAANHAYIPNHTHAMPTKPFQHANCGGPLQDRVVAEKILKYVNVFREIS